MGRNLFSGRMYADRTVYPVAMVMEMDNLVLFLPENSKLPLQLRPIHSDEAGGIGFLGEPPGPFIPVTLAFAIIISSGILEQVIYLGHKLPEFYFAIIAVTVFAIILNMLPLAVFIGPLGKASRQAIFEYGLLVQQHHHRFEETWINSRDPGSIMGNPDASSAADINSVYQSVKSMKVVPFNIKTMVSSIVICIIPMLPLFVLQYSVKEIIQKVLSLLL